MLVDELTYNKLLNKGQNIPSVLAFIVLVNPLDKPFL